MGNNQGKVLDIMNQDRKRPNIPLQDTPANRQKKLAQIAETQRIFYQYINSSSEVEKANLQKQLIERSIYLTQKEKADYRQKVEHPRHDPQLPAQKSQSSQNSERFTKKGLNVSTARVTTQHIESSQDSERLTQYEKKIQQQILKELSSYEGIIREAPRVRHIYMIGQSGNSNSTRATIYGPNQSERDQQQADQKCKLARKCHANKQYQKAYEKFEQALELSIESSKKRPNERTAVIYNQRGVVLYCMRRFQEATQSIKKSLQEAKEAMRISRKQVQQWYYWQAVMGNLILALKSDGNIETAEKLQRQMAEQLKINPYGQIFKVEHITAFFSSKQPSNIHPQAFKKGSYSPDLAQNQSFRQLRTDIRHIQEVSRQHQQITNRIIQSSLFEDRDRLLTKNQIFEQIKTSLITPLERHILILSAQGQNGSMQIKTRNNPHGEPLDLQSIFDRCILSEQIQHIKSLTIYLDCDFSGSMAESLLKSMPQRNLSSIYNTDIQVICSSGSDSQNQDSERFGGLLVCNYWESRIPNALNQDQKNILSRRFQEANPCMIEYMNNSVNNRVQSRWSLVKSVTWNGIQNF